MKKLIVLLVTVAIIIFNIHLLSNKNEQPVTAPESLKNISLSDNKADKIIDVPTICQYPEFPTGCESVSAVMLLQYYNIDITVTDFINSWLECGDDPYYINDVLYGSNPNTVFVGSPFSENSYGCYAPVIVNAINSHSTECTAVQIKNKSLDDICSEYIDNDKPVLIWATTNMQEPQRGATWLLEDGSEFTWISKEHCLVLIGYNDDYYFFNDPQLGDMVAFEKNIVKKRFIELRGQAISVLKKFD